MTLHRTPLVLMGDLSRSLLNLLGETDAQLRALERHVQANPGDGEAAAKLARTRQRSGIHPDKPDNDHHWRFNGKGWYTRPDWNGGRCPPGSEPTNHNSCLPAGAHPNDQAQYRTSKSVGDDMGNGQHRHVIGPDEPVDPGGTVLYGPENPPDEEGNRVMFHSSPHRHRSKNAGSVQWDGPNGPQILSRPRDYRDAPEPPGPRPLPDSPEHLPMFMDHNRSRQRRLQAKIVQHYSRKGFHPEYTKRALRLAPVTSDPERMLSPETVHRLPAAAAGPARQRIVRRARNAIMKSILADTA